MDNLTAQRRTTWPLKSVYEGRHIPSATRDVLRSSLWGDLKTKIPSRERVAVDPGLANTRLHNASIHGIGHAKFVHGR